MASISERESRDIEAANASGTTPVVFIHGLWLLPSSWANWADFFMQARLRAVNPRTGQTIPKLFRRRGRTRASSPSTRSSTAGRTPSMRTRRKGHYGTYHMAGSGIALAQMANANLNSWTESKVDTKNPDRGPLLILDWEKDHTVPWAIANASYERQQRNPSVAEIKKMPNRGHSLTVDHGLQDVAQTALDFGNRFVPAKPS